MSLHLTSLQTSSLQFDLVVGGSSGQGTCYTCSHTHTLDTSEAVSWRQPSVEQHVLAVACSLRGSLLLWCVLRCGRAFPGPRPLDAWLVYLSKWIVGQWVRRRRRCDFSSSTNSAPAASLWALWPGRDGIHPSCASSSSLAGPRALSFPCLQEAGLGPVLWALQGLSASSRRPRPSSLLFHPTLSLCCRAIALSALCLEPASARNPSTWPGF